MPTFQIRAKLIFVFSAAHFDLKPELIRHFFPLYEKRPSIDLKEEFKWFIFWKFKRGIIFAKSNLCQCGIYLGTAQDT